MSTTQDLPVESTEASQAPDEAPDAEAPGGVRGWLLERRSLVAAAAVIGLIGGGTAAWFGVRHDSTPGPTTAISLPSTLSGLPTLAADPLHGASWQQKATQAAAGTAWAARTYGHAGAARTIRVVIARTDLTGKLEQAWAVGNGTQAGHASCTHNTRLTPSSKPHERPTVLVCWRTSATLSAYALVIDPKAKTPVPDADGAGPLDTVWRAAGGTD